MGCGSCSTGGGCAPAGCKSNGNCLTGGCQKLEVYDWLSNLDMPSNYIPFQVVEVKFKGARKEFFLNNDNIYLEIGEIVAVEGPTGGYDIGHVSLTGELVRTQMKRRKTPLDQVTRKIYRKASDADVEKWKLAKDMEWETMHKARTFALELGLSMKISDVDFQGDKTKATFYYTAEGRVDFRELIKRMAEAFRIRIEMRQIGMRQEAGRLGGIGSCGRELCCSNYISSFQSITTSAARCQDLSLNPQKLAGQCGKLKCCLNYETAAYMDAQSRIPKVHNPLEFEDGLAYLMKTDILREIMYFSYDPSSLANLYPLYAEDVWDIIRMNRNGEKPESLKRDAEPVAPEFVTAVGDDAINRFDEARKRKKKKKSRSGNGEQKPAENNGEKRQGGHRNHKGGNRNGGNRRGDRPKKDAPSE